MEMANRATKKKRMDIRQGDEVLVMSGKDRSYKGRQKRGKVIGALPQEERLLVAGTNIIKRAVRQNQRVRQGGIIESPGPIHRSNLMLICPQCDQPTRVAYRINEQGQRVRVCKKCHKDIE